MASVVHCNLLHVDGHTYRLRAAGSIGGRHPHQHHYEEVQEADEAAFVDEAQQEAEAELIDPSLITQEGDTFLTHISVDSQLLGFVIGRDGHTRKEIESATGATLSIPRPGSSKQQHPRGSGTVAAAEVVVGSRRSETITIKAASKAALSSARIRTELVISGAINGRLLDYTHFVSLPLNSPTAAAQLTEFQQQVLSQPGAAAKGLHPSIFISPATLHLTLLMLKLYSDEARQAARQVLRDLQPQVSDLLAGRPLVLQLSGLDHMTDDPSEMHVLYLKVQEPGKQQQRLPALCDLVVRRFKEAGLLVPGQQEFVKLHATIINTRHRRGDHGQHADAAGAGGSRSGRGGSRGGGGGAPRMAFDGRELLAEFGDLSLGSFEVPALHLSERGAYDAAGYYKCFDKLQLA